MTDFFISYTSTDEKWAEWIGYTLEENGYSVVLQRWDFRPGTNFVLEMQQAATTADKTVMVLSPDYMKSQFASPEWAAAFAKDPRGLGRLVIPVVVRECRPDGLLGQIVHINIAGADEATARTELLRGVRPERAKPSSRPTFPGTTPAPQKSFPGRVGTPQDLPRKAYMPRIHGGPSDAEKRKFLRVAFAMIKSHFETGLRELSEAYRDLEFDFQLVTAKEFTAEVFLRGQSVAACRIWQGGMFSENSISYGEGRLSFGTNSCNESLSVAVSDGETVLSSMMGGVFLGRDSGNFDTRAMASEQAAEYLWRAFVNQIERAR